ncbi:ABC transporter ATP-binding protein [Paenibacillus allorhizosphaerae]|uniref:Multidrug export ATP-binding/permease protein n=1 Tax=Paenibacillus allorhizosphaerae TaxID=2849866 RepID=A0ABN7TDE5_9BACL|nr:ABC transporter ATP-binding protein [Paenibacillus allorhizosphaerae]CAG7618760.1 Putative multidrug export ATP-binding/permease protein [Paenibacillus allorhizosphaerae]
MNKAKATPSNDKEKKVTLRRVFALFAPYRMRAVWITTIAIAGSLISLIPPLLMKSIIDVAVPEKKVALLLLLGGGILFVNLLSGLLDVLQHHLENIVGQKIMSDLRMNMYTRLLKQSMSFYTRSRSGEVIQRFTGDIQMIQTVVTRSAVTAVTQSTIWMTSVLLLLTLDFKLACLALLLLPFYIVPARKTARIRKRILAESQQVKSDIASHLAETTGISGALLIRMHCREKKMAGTFFELSQKATGIDLKMNLVGRWIAMFNGALPSIGTLLIYVYGGYSAMQGSMTVGGIIAFSAYLSRLYNPTQQLLNLHSDLVASLAVFEKLFDYADMEPEVLESITARTLPPLKGQIRFNNVTFRYSPDKPALSNVSFEARPGELVAIVGPSGAGKSTLINLLARLHDTTSGNIVIDGYDLREVTIESLRSRLAFVTQDSYLFHASVKENVMFSRLDATEEELEDACKKAHIHEYIQSLPERYETIVGERGYQLSGGERQRLCIARAILKKPDILVLDEATSQLDSQSESFVQAALEQVMKQCTTIVIAHRLSTIVKADQIIVLDRGSVVESGTHPELLARNGLYSKLYRTQFCLSP